VYEELEDEKLMGLYVAGDEAAFRELFARYKGRVYAYVYRATSDKRMAEDLFQRVFLKVHRSRSRFDESRVFAAWLFAICRNVARDYVAKEKARPEVPVEKPSEVNAAIAPQEETPDASWNAMLSELPERQKKALEMRFGENLEFSEIARVLETSESNARQIISRAVRKVKERLK
jgi:RNA polymerase sigma-70 factor (ECF subfamily)